MPVTNSLADSQQGQQKAEYEQASHVTSPEHLGTGSHPAGTVTGTYLTRDDHGWQTLKMGRGQADTGPGDRCSGCSRQAAPVARARRDGPATASALWAGGWPA